MATEEVVPPAHQVADAFVEQYYKIMRVVPQEAYRLYVDSSVVSRPGPDGTTMLSFTSVEAINKQLLSSDYENTTYEVLSVDSHNSVEDGVLIMVIGFLTAKDNLKRKFSQMFYLARQHNAVHVVLNDIFRFVDVNVPATEVVKPAGELNNTEPIQKTDVNAAEVKNVNASEVENVSEATPSLDKGKNKHSDDKVVIAQNQIESAVETAPPQLDGAKRSFAAIVQSLAENAAPFQLKAPVQKPKYTSQARAAAAPVSKSEKRVYQSEKRVYQKIIEEPGTSIFVANLPMTAMPPQLHELFKDFGPIKENGIQVRSTRAKEVCFGFVAFESATSVQSVLQVAKNSPFMLADRKLRVKEKEVDYDGSKPSGKTGGGSKIQNGSADVSKIQNGPADGSKTENASADGGDDFVPAERKHRNRNRKNGGRIEKRGDWKSSEGGAAPEVQQA